MQSPYVFVPIMAHRGTLRFLPARAAHTLLEATNEPIEKQGEAALLATGWDALLKICHQSH